MSTQHQEKSDTSCCPSKKKTTSCGGEHDKKSKKDWLLWASSIILCASIVTHTILSIFDASPLHLHHFANTSIEILSTMWWGVALGIIIIGLMSKVPREYFTALMGTNNSFTGLLRAVFGGLFLDLCCHGILLVAAKLYERGVSLAQVITFLVASPWNSLSLTLVLITLIGLKWTLLYILGSVIIALITGLIFQKLVQTGALPDNPNKPDESTVQSPSFKALFKDIKWSKAGSISILKSGWNDGKMIIKWLLFGTVIAASLRTFIPQELFADLLGPTLAGLFLTLFFATIVEICSEGSAPIAGEIFTSAKAPGNGFTFLMAGVATDYTEIMAIRGFANSWKIALALPLITVPQVVFIGWIMNTALS